MNTLKDYAGIVMMITAIVFSSLVMTLLFTAIASGAEVKEVRFEVESHYNLRDPFLPDYTVGQRPQLQEYSPKKEEWSYSIRLINEFSLFKGILGETLWYNKVTGASTTTRFRYVGYEYRFTQQITPGFGIYYHHHSEHGIDIDREEFPLQDSFGVSLCFIGTKC